MDPEYKDIFEQLYQVAPDPGYPGLQYWRFPVAPPRFAEDVAAVRQAIDQAERELVRSERRRIRADGKYFLFLNFMEMVFVPMRIRGTGFGGEERSALLSADMSLLVDTAARLQAERERSPGAPGQFRGQLIEEPELSGHSVLESVALNWKNLKLSDFRIWGED